MNDDRADGPQRARLPGFEDPAEPRRPAYNWYPGYGGPPPGYPWQQGYARDDGIRSSRRASSWTAAALIAGVAATTGYLAHAIPSTGSSTTGNTTGKGKTTAHHKSKATTVVPSTPYVAPPVTTSGGSGAAGGGGGGGD